MGRVEPVIPARGEALSNFDLFQRLAEKMGYDEEPFRQTIGERLDDYIGTLQGIPDVVRKEGLQPGVTVTSDKLESAGNYSRFQGKRFQFAPPHVDPPVPQVLPNREFANAELQKRFPLRLITPPMLGLLNSTFGERFPKEIGTGQNRRTLVISEDTQPDLVVMQGIYWENDSSGMTGVNDLTSQQTTDLGAGGTFHEALVEVRSHNP
jgi:anaerobic selenocysteine-containing dehydrogenase